MTLDEVIIISQRMQEIERLEDTEIKRQRLENVLGDLNQMEQSIIRNKFIERVESILMKVR